MLDPALTAHCRPSLGNGVMVLHGPLRVPSRVAKGWRPQRGIPHTQNSKLCGHAIQVQADPVEVSVGGASGEGRSHSVLRGSIFRNRFLGWVQQNSIDVGQFPEHPQEG